MPQPSSVSSSRILDSSDADSGRRLQMNPDRCHVQKARQPPPSLKMKLECKKRDSGVQFIEIEVRIRAGNSTKRQEYFLALVVL